MKALRILAIVAALAVVATWAALGAHRGWTMTEVPVKKIDPITDIEFTEYDHRFVPGVDFLATGLLGSGALFALTIFISKLQTKSKS